MDVHAKFDRTGFKDFGDMIICVGWGGGGGGGGKSAYSPLKGGNGPIKLSLKAEGHTCQSGIADCTTHKDNHGLQQGDNPRKSHN